MVHRSVGQKPARPDVGHVPVNERGSREGAEWVMGIAEGYLEHLVSRQVAWPNRMNDEEHQLV
jgi:hypothetical protein